jgi:hypothetical protein
MGIRGEGTLRRNLGRKSGKGQEVHGIYGYGAVVTDFKKSPFGCALDLAERTRPAGETRRMEMKSNGQRKKGKKEPRKK